MSKTVGLAAGLVVVILAAGWFVSRPRGSDAEQVQQVLSSGLEAVRNKNLWGAMSCLSSDYHGEGESADNVRLMLLELFRDSDDIRVVLDDPEIAVHGDTAVVTGLGRASVITRDGSRMDRNSEATIVLRKENHHRYLIYPTREWKIVSALLRTEAQSFP